MSNRVLIVGATGTFGRRLTEHLAATTDFEIIVGARRLPTAHDFAALLRGRFPDLVIEPRALDASTVTPGDLRDLGAWCVVDTAGPFQGSRQRLAEIAIAAGCHYVDISDARDFVAVFPRLDAAAKCAAVLAVTGASSTPALGQLVLDHLVAGWRSIDSVEIAISPGNRQPRGLSVVKAILSGAGRPMKVYEGGRWSISRGMSGLVRRRMPGLGNRWLFLIDTPDLDLIPARFAPQRFAIFRAGLELTFLHLGIWALSKVVVIGLLPSLVPLAGPLRWLAERLRTFGSGRGGMAVDVEGLDREGRPSLATWALVAHEADGPFIPVLPAAAVMRALAEGRITATGAMACIGLVSLSDMHREFSRYHIVTRCAKPLGNRKQPALDPRRDLQRGSVTPAHRSWRQKHGSDPPLRPQSGAPSRRQAVHQAPSAKTAAESARDEI
jgi:hypothetical protein